MLSGWYVDIFVGHLIRILIRTVKARGSDRWAIEKGMVTGSRSDPAPYGGPVAEVTCTYEGKYFSGMQREPCTLRGSAEEYAARFREGSDIIARVKPGEPEVSIVRQRDQAIGILTYDKK